MKVALITFHNALNYGAALQVYAAQQAIKKLGVDCEIIDYVNESRNNAYSMSYHIKEQLKKKRIKSTLKYCVGSIFINKRRTKFEKFYSENLKCTPKRYTSSNEANELNGKYDKFIVGSDQVWNNTNNGNDFAYFLDFVKDDNKKISYSSSFGLAEVPENLKEGYASNLKKIKHLSTRESYGVQLIKELTDRDAELVLDPVFLLDKSHWETLYTEKKNKERYIFCYTNGMSQFENFIFQTGYPLEGLKIYKLSKYLTIKDFLNPNVKVVYSLSPSEFIATVANAELVVSASFHCIAMAIVLKVPFVAVLSGNKGRDERILNILRIAGLEDRILNESMTLNDVNKTIDYKLVESRFAKYVESSLEFLRKSIYS